MEQNNPNPNPFLANTERFKAIFKPYTADSYAKIIFNFKEAIQTLSDKKIGAFVESYTTQYQDGSSHKAVRDYIFFIQDKKSRFTMTELFRITFDVDKPLNCTLNICVYPSPQSPITNNGYTVKQVQFFEESIQSLEDSIINTLVQEMGSNQYWKDVIARMMGD